MTGGYDAELRRHDAVLRRAAGVRPHDRVLDIGCGAGHTTRWAARAAERGSVLGVDVSPAAVARARALARDLPNVTFEVADAQVHPFPAGHFDLAISRFGTMFFADPVAAFRTVGRALRPGGRLVMTVWQSGDRNEWDVVLRRSLGVAVWPTGPDPFTLADPASVTAVLDAAGYTGVSCTGVEEPVHYGADVTAALDWVLGFTNVRAVLDPLGSAATAGALERLREALAAHLTDEGVVFGSRAWLVTARRPPSRRVDD